MGAMAVHLESTLLAPQATRQEIAKLCAEAAGHGMYAVCVNPAMVAAAKEFLAAGRVLTVTVIGFPLGATYTAVKVEETRIAVSEGADEIDMVINVGWVKEGRYPEVTDEIKKVVAAAGKAPVKVIIEAGLLSDEEKCLTSRAAAAGGAAFVKTGTGFFGAARVEDACLIKKALGNADLGIKAAGGIRTAEQAEQFLLAGAERIGTSAAVQIIAGETS